MSPAEPAAPDARFSWRDLGPALIVASVVLGPGSILTASKVGCETGTAMLWVLALAAAVMAGTAALSARLGCTLGRSPCDALAARLGRPFAAAVGVTLFLVVVGFQSSNNTAVLAGLGPLLGDPPPAVAAGVLLAVNGLVAAALFGLRGLYKKLELLMKALLAVMAAAFAVNFFAAGPSPVEIAAGLIPSLPAADARPDGAAAYFFPYRDGDTIRTPHWALQGLIATTFSVAGAFYQAYLVREKGWGARDRRRAGGDVLVGIAALAVMSGMILLTAAATLHGRVDPAELTSTADVAEQLRPAFGDAAVWLFSAGIFAGAFGSFLGNAVIGGTLLADGFGRGSALDSAWVRGATFAALAAGAGIALFATTTGIDPVSVIVLAQALTVLGGPLLMGSLLFLALKAPHRPPWYVLAAAVAGGLLAVLLAVRTAWTLALKAGWGA